MTRIVRGSLIALASRVAAAGLGLGVTLVTARLGVTSQGTFALYTAIESALLLMGSGWAAVIARRISHFAERPVGLVSATTLWSIAMGLLCTLLLIIGGRLHTVEFLMPLVWTAPLMLVAPNLIGVWLGSARMTAMALQTLAPVALTLLGIGIVFVRSGVPSLISVLWCWALARASVGVFVLAMAWRERWLGAPDWRALIGQLRFSAIIGATNLVALMNYKVDLFLVERLLGRADTGVYSIAVLIAELLWLISSSVTQASYAGIGTADRSMAGKRTAKAVRLSLLTLLLISPLIWAAAVVVLPRLLGPGYEHVPVLLAALLPGVVMYGAASGLSAYFTNHAGRPMLPALLAGLSLVLTLVLSGLLIPAYGALGAAVATTLSYIVAVCVSMLMFAWMSGQHISRLFVPDQSDLQAVKGLFRRLSGVRS
ncbi:MAG: polysaccharide biosynthesis C-terminal domain-containing protein [Burkholderiaceae bacterium]|nr:polysaccharide biosynthesis C-terminal domain-containing protein [Burkholderiaceae bacterium]